MTSNSRRLVARQARPDLPQRVDRVDVGDDRVVARPGQALVVEMAAGAAADDRRIGHWDLAEGAPDAQPGDDPGTSGIRLSGR